MRRTRGLFVLNPLLALRSLGIGPCGTHGFDLGVGAFEVDKDRAILWTHAVSADPSAKSIGFRVELATDPGLTNVVRKQAVTAKAKHDFTARVLLTSLKPATQYHYRFIAEASAASSRVGSFRTAPAISDDSPVRIVISGDSNLGFTEPLGLDFHVLSAAAAEDPDFFVFYGDTGG